jgi:hypothetical protein
MGAKGRGGQHSGTLFASFATRRRIHVIRVFVTDIEKAGCLDLARAVVLPFEGLSLNHWPAYLDVNFDLIYHRHPPFTKVDAAPIA